MGARKKLSEQTLFGFAWLITGSGVQAVLKIGVLAVLARLISPHEFGLVGLALIVVEFSKLFIHMGVGPAIVQRKDLTDSHLKTGFTLSLVMGVLCAALLILAAPFIASFFKMEGLVPVLQIIAVVFLIDSVTLVGQALMQRHLKFKELAGIEVISYAVGYGVVGITLGFLNWGVWSLVIAHLSQSVLYAVLIMIVQPSPVRLGFSSSAFKDLIYFGGGMTLGRIGNYIANQGDNLVVGRMLGAGALGIYGRAYQFMVMPAGLFGTALDKTLFPAMAKVQDDKQKLAKAYLTGIGMIALVAIPISILSVLLAPEIVSVLLGPDWGAVTLPFQILASSLLFRMSYKMSDSLARATGAVYKRAWRQMIYAVLVVSGAYLGQFWGLHGVAYGVVIALITNFFLMLQLSVGLTSIRWIEVAAAHQHGILLGLATGVISMASTVICRHYLASDLLTLLATLTFTAAFVSTAVYYFPKIFISGDQLELLSKPFKKTINKQHPQSV